ncbi:MAG: hypothetical protein K2X35_20545 [Bryobacteraceae bacterium]|nr:hypothetical protein [Bryobacteraceae bacterium]
MRRGRFDRAGVEVHAAAFLRRRELMLHAELRDSPRELSRILVHELFHFAWLRLGNTRRDSWMHLLRKELDLGARGELGWSAEWRKRRSPSPGSLAFREYACESFCDSGACFYSLAGRHPEFTLKRRFRDRRRAWFRDFLETSGVRL